MYDEIAFKRDLHMYCTANNCVAFFICTIVLHIQELSREKDEINQQIEGIIFMFFNKMKMLGIKH